MASWLLVRVRNKYRERREKHRGAARSTVNRALTEFDSTEFSFVVVRRNLSRVCKSSRIETDCFPLKFNLLGVWIDERIERYSFRRILNFEY